MAQLMPLPLTISCSCKPRLVLPFWYQLTQVVPDKIQKSRKTIVCVCARARAHACCTPSMPLSIFLFPISILFLLFLYCFSNFLNSITTFPWTFDKQHEICTISIIIFFICCQCSFTSRYFHSAAITLSLTMLWYY